MSILLVNDDGYRSTGLHAAHKVLSDIDDVFVVIPDRQRSGCSHSISLSKPIQLHEISPNFYECSGTPADCVKIGYREVLKGNKPDLVVSGINPGGNIGSAVHYSGTIAGAAEAAMMGFPSIAISIAGHNPLTNEVAVSYLKKIVPQILDNGLPRWVFLNVNVPDLPAEEIQGVKLVPQGITFYDDHFQQYVDAQGKLHFWMVGDVISFDEREENDVIAISQGYIAVTPIFLEVTAHSQMDYFRKWDI